jgi:hypothetical protein
MVHSYDTIDMWGSRANVTTRQMDAIMSLQLLKPVRGRHLGNASYSNLSAPHWIEIWLNYTLFVDTD